MASLFFCTDLGGVVGRDSRANSAQHDLTRGNSFLAGCGLAKRRVKRTVRAGVGLCSALVSIGAVEVVAGSNVGQRAERPVQRGLGFLGQHARAHPDQLPRGEPSGAGAYALSIELQHGARR